MKENIKEKATVFVIFGGSGDLTNRKLAPALYNLFLDDWMPDQFDILGIASSKMSQDKYKEWILSGINDFSRNGKVEKKVWNKFSDHLVYHSFDFEDEGLYKMLEEFIQKREKEWNQPVNLVVYLAVAPKFFSSIPVFLHKYKYAQNKDLARIVIEKPFGHDLESARTLNKELAEMFDEKQIYRIDHYLGKETVQNIMAFRFANSILEPIWNRNYIEHIQISVTEELGVEDRGRYYEGAGALRDMVQNHLLQLLCLIAMETPINFDADELRNRKVEVLKAMRRFKPEDIRKETVRGQYGKGWMESEEVVGYRSEEKVSPDSNTETYAAVKFFIDNWRWQGVPFYVRTGKRLHQTSSMISIQFKDVPHCIFTEEAADSWQQNRLIISIQPEMSIRLQLQAKRPGLEMNLNPVDMVFNYEGTYTKGTPEAYETLLMDIMQGDQSLFMRADQVEAAWDLLMPILSAWQSKKSISFPNYSAGSWGPELAEALIAQDGFHWFNLPMEKE